MSLAGRAGATAELLRVSLWWPKLTILRISCRMSSEPCRAHAHHPLHLMQDVQRALQAEKEAHSSETQKVQELEAMAQQLSSAKAALAEDAARAQERMAALSTQHAGLEERHTGLQQSHEELASQNGTLRQQVGPGGDHVVSF